MCSDSYNAPLGLITSTTPSPPAEASTLLAALWRSANSIHQVGKLDRATGKFRNLHVQDVISAVARAQTISAERKDAYFACAEYITPNSRIATNVSGAFAFWLDIDCSEDTFTSGKGYATEADARDALEQFCRSAGLPQATHIVSSGAGLHAYWVLDAFVDPVTWQAYATKFKSLTTVLKFLVDGCRTADIASVLRIPGTLNYKYSPPRPVTLMHASGEYISRTVMLDALEDAHNRLCDAVPTSLAPVSNNGDEDRRRVTPAGIQALLSYIDPDIEYLRWVQVLMAIFHETGGGEQGLEIADAWSAKGKKYKGRAEIKAKWASFKSARTRPITIATVCQMVTDKGHDWMSVIAEAEDPFETCETTVEHRRAVAPEDGEKGNGVEAGSQPANKNRKGAYFSEALAGVQRQFALLNMNGKFCVFDQIALEQTTDKGTAQRLTPSNRSDGSLMVERAVRAKYPQAKAEDVVEEFWVSPQTTCYQGVDFNPTGAASNYLNLWVGPTIIPKSGSWSRIKYFLHRVICDGDEECYQYLVGYLAHALQRPQEKPGVMIILIGGQGIGKGTVARILGRIWGATFLQISNIDSVTGNFNSSLERAYIVFMDEALFAGDRKASDSLKSLVTEPVIHINEKYQPARQTSSVHRFFAATNADHFKNTERDDRRDFALRVSEVHKGDREYWKALYHEIDNGGTEAMVHDLLAMDLSEFDVRVKPDTKELLEQKLKSLGAIPRWWHEALCNGELSEDGNWSEFISTEDVINGVMDMAGGKIYRKPAAIEVVQAFAKLCPSATKGQRKDGLNSRKRGLCLPPLEQARTEFDQYIGGAVKWDLPLSSDEDMSQPAVDF